MEREIVESQVRRILELYGYREIRTPVLTEDIWATDNKSSFLKKEGKNFSLRPEITSEILKNIRFEGIPIRVFYMGPIFDFKDEVEEKFQIGWELIFPPSRWRDIEIILTIKDVFDTFNLEDFKLELNDIRVWNSVWSCIENSEEIKKLKGYLKKRDYVSFLEEMTGKVPSSLQKDIKNMLFYEEDAKFESEEISFQLEELKSLKKELIEFGFREDSIILNPSFFRSFGYYDGIIFELYVKDMKGPLGGGGSYIESNKFGEKVYGVGFAFIEEKILDFLKEGKPLEKKKFFIVPSDFYASVYNLMKEERENGFNSVFIPFDKNLDIEKLKKEGEVIFWRDKNDKDSNPHRTSSE
ncbi:MAG TPA: ATP phosphoribosyltransferase regulatory subunit [Dictyoglomaceae bacterium]|nr:ATP phosphoribosyltransferase regulatory subunit [Dictyoglomaceae bacterium]HOL38700.1 ATP phosphoribosyltransferase regulatory subunit [Dictyoglomaceae bacterium]HOP94596.1 ATP phosphoribosyltransferase regulatory subunit [Dictyoglomaceae bacterium]HPP15551.1 ATP phosphoribosyltransferase regulatory subunit [Dictyoglomaceae bacterium]HPU42866.1 ATP phosphoribosyltransferase regulatory subunit [Dictyoglomaceae bacterium]